MQKKPSNGKKAKKRLPRKVKSKIHDEREGNRTTTGTRDEVRRVTTHRQGHPK
jgi:hypothetical protein